MENERLIELQLLNVLTEEKLADYEDETIRKQKKK